jgi:triosephosphate isomerase (TIM)
MLPAWPTGASSATRSAAATRRDDELVARKLLRCAEHGLRPILCVGEQLAEREAGGPTTVRDQLEATVAELAATEPSCRPTWSSPTSRYGRSAPADARAASDAAGWPG